MIPLLLFLPFFCQRKSGCHSMTEKKFYDHEVLRLVDDKGLSQAEAARKLGTTRQAVHNRLKEMTGRSTKVVVSKNVEKAVERKIDAMDQLNKINGYANELLDLCMRWQRGDPEALQILESQIRKVRVGKTEEFIKKMKFKDPRQLALQAMNEIRNQVKLQLEIFQTIYSLKAAEEFQKTVLEIIGDVDPDVRRKIIDRLNTERSIRGAVRFHQ